MKNMIKKLKKLVLCLSLISVFLDITVCYGMTGTTGKKRNHELSLGENSSEKEREEERELAKRKRTGDQDTVSGQTAGFSGDPWAGSVTGTGPEDFPKASFATVLSAETAAPAGETEETKDFLEIKSEIKRAVTDDGEEDASVSLVSLVPRIKKPDVPRGEAAAAFDPRVTTLLSSCFGSSEEPDEKDSDHTGRADSWEDFGDNLLTVLSKKYILTDASGVALDAARTSKIALSHNGKYVAYVKSILHDFSDNSEYVCVRGVPEVIDMSSKKSLHVPTQAFSTPYVRPASEDSDNSVRGIFFSNDDQFIIFYALRAIIILQWDSREKLYVLYDQFALSEDAGDVWIQSVALNKSGTCLALATSSGNILIFQHGTPGSSTRFFSDSDNVIRLEVEDASPKIKLYFLSDSIVQFHSKYGFYDIVKKESLSDDTFSMVKAINDFVRQSYQEKFTGTDITVSVTSRRYSQIDESDFITVISTIFCYRGRQYIHGYCEAATYKFQRDWSVEKVNQLEGVFCGPEWGLQCYLQYYNDYENNSITEVTNPEMERVFKVYDYRGQFYGLSSIDADDSFESNYIFDRTRGTVSCIVANRTDNRLRLMEWTCLHGASLSAPYLRAREAGNKRGLLRLTTPKPEVSIEKFVAWVIERAGVLV